MRHPMVWAWAAMGYYHHHQHYVMGFNGASAGSTDVIQAQALAKGAERANDRRHVIDTTRHAPRRQDQPPAWLPVSRRHRADGLLVET